ncbi:tyrosine-type recombinase/integrase [Halalkalibacter akibai]|uniref:Integrase-recombinase protein n=1 Tax=Halalkalibacter akibai (strain ATCC 43226 / DSM 21942 / CIP 109018 / JCM 9157 / 1139) TaxID=1236973 RepID=W4QUD6_HALA3|nr:site-specific integrase [Halalkalibacter akibai]GAE35701.1 integrase-recombinase protein [Halalkalibacter akibai JCM 9157]
MHIEQRPEIEPEIICEQYGIDLKDFFNLLQGSRRLESSKTAVEIINEYKDKIAKDLKLERKTADTIYYYNYFLERFKVFLNKINPNFCLLDLNEEIMDDFYNLSIIRKGKISPGTKNTYQAIINALINFAYTQKYISEDIRSRFEVYKCEKLPRYIPTEVIKKLLNESLKTSSPFFNYTVLYFLIGTGCRISELVNVRIGDFKVDENIIFIRKGKGNKERYIPMYPEVKKVVLDFLSRTGVKEIAYTDERHLFSKRIYDNRKPVLIRSIQKMLQNLLEALGIDNQYSPHSFRHSFAVQSIKQGMRIEILQQVLGHDHMETTAIYTKLHPQDLKDEVVGKYPFPFEKLLKHMLGFEG